MALTIVPIKSYVSIGEAGGDDLARAVSLFRQWLTTNFATVNSCIQDVRGGGTMPRDLYTSVLV
jgi:hypothetical protein